MGYFSNISQEEQSALHVYDKDHEYDVMLIIANTLDYTRFTIEVLGKRSTLTADVLVEFEYLNDVIQAVEGKSEFICDDYAGDRTTLLVGRDESGNLTAKIEVVKGHDLHITLDTEAEQKLLMALRAQIEDVEARPRVTKTYADWQRIAKANEDQGLSYYASIIRNQLAGYGYYDSDKVEVVFDDEFDRDQVLEVCTVELSATVATWQRTAEHLRSDRNESLALAIEDAVIEHEYGASPVQQVELSFDWNDAPGIKDALWRVAILGDYAEATKPFVSLVMVG